MTLMLPALVLSACERPAPPRGGPPAESGASTVAFDYGHPPAIVVPVYINGDGPHAFILDTGASYTCVDLRLAVRLALPRRGAPRGVGVGVGMLGAFEMVGADSLRVGTARATRLEACLLDLSQFRQLGVKVDGLLGLNFLEKFRVTLDFEEKKMTLTAKK